MNSLAISQSVSGSGERGPKGNDGRGISSISYDNPNDQFIFDMSDNTQETISFPGVSLDTTAPVKISGPNNTEKLNVKNASNADIFNIDTTNNQISTFGATSLNNDLIIAGSSENNTVLIGNNSMTDDDKTRIVSNSDSSDITLEIQNLGSENTGLNIKKGSNGAKIFFDGSYLNYDRIQYVGPVSDQIPLSLHSSSNLCTLSMQANTGVRSISVDNNNNLIFDNGNIIPQTTDTNNLGRSDRIWRDFYASAGIFTNAVSCSVIQTSLSASTLNGCTFQTNPTTFAAGSDITLADGVSLTTGNGNITMGSGTLNKSAGATIFGGTVSMTNNTAPLSTRSLGGSTASRMTLTNSGTGSNTGVSLTFNAHNGTTATTGSVSLVNSHLNLTPHSGGNIINNSHIVPSSDNALDLGTTTNRIRHIYANYIGFGDQTTFDLNHVLQGPNSSIHAAKAFAWNTYSNLSMKENIQDLSNSLNTIDQLRAVSFTWKQGFGDNITQTIIDPDTNEETQIVHQPTTQHGFIAEEICQVLPYACSFNESNQPTGVDYSKVVPLLVSCVKELKTQIADLQNQIDLINGS